MQTDSALIKPKKDKDCRLCKKLFDCPGKDPRVTLCLQYEERERWHDEDKINRAAAPSP